ncbi:DUF397 domain-containing protein [Nocardia tengchongensis]|uniref:DUF397 domain-containing protein n=1 Tax=Nocardia tengchongensis TaxID=2055889 RepID=A0ABX8CNW9_9NOCA|nr:DUF397 domain-containing protein [Nocardia tengchongensis]QVI21046.1 DUF397 domain-containing protein [Nocardia tengchongensis]
MTDDLSAADWFKSSYSGDKADCVEVAFLADARVGVRDSKDADGPVLVFAPEEWDLLTNVIARGRFDRG